jgi:hypothetical protein
VRGLNVWADTEQGVHIPLPAAIGYHTLHANADHVIFEYEKPLPLFTWADQVESSFWYTEKARIDRLFAEDFDPDRRLLLDVMVPPASQLWISDEVTSATVGKAQWFSPSEVGCEVEAEGQGHLVFWETYYDGWHATIDGEPAEVKQANALFCAVKVPAGKHQVRLWWRPPWLWPGIILCLLGIAAEAALVWVCIGRSRSKPKEQTEKPEPAAVPI